MVSLALMDKILSIDEEKGLVTVSAQPGWQSCMSRIAGVHEGSVGAGRRV